MSAAASVLTPLGTTNCPYTATCRTGYEVFVKRIGVVTDDQIGIAVAIEVTDGEIIGGAPLAACNRPGPHKCRPLWKGKTKTGVPQPVELMKSSRPSELKSA